MKLSENLKNIRKVNNLSQEQLAEKLGVSRQAVSKWESGQSYPEMDKVLLICKTFNYNIDELMNESVKEVDEIKQSKLNINKYIDDFFSYITKTVDMLGIMRFKEKLKCFIEQITISIVLVCIFAIIAVIGSEILLGLFGGLNGRIYFFIRDILKSIYLIISSIIGITILLHIFKIRYLDYYQIIREDSNKNEDKIEDNKEEKSNDQHKKFIKDKTEKIIIRDPNHSQSRFLTGIAKIILLCIKGFTIFTGICFSFSLIFFTTVLVLSFLFVKTGMLFLGGLLTIISALIVNFIILDILYNFIISRKNKKHILAIAFVISLLLAGIGIGFVLIDSANFTYIEDLNNKNIVEDVFSIEMEENLTIESWDNNIEYVENELNEIKIVVKRSKYDTVNTSFDEKEQRLLIYNYQDSRKFGIYIKDNIENINNSQIITYTNPTITVFTSQENIDKLKQNKINKNNLKMEFENQVKELNNTIQEKEEEIYNLSEKLTEKDIIIEELENKLYKIETNIDN